MYKPPAALGCTAQSKLVLFMPGTAWGPEDNDFPMEHAAYAGFRTIGLSNANHWETSGWCQDYALFASDPSTKVCHDENFTDAVSDYADECGYWMRRERITGVDDPRSSYDPTFSYATNDQEDGFKYLDGFPEEDSIVYRLLYTLAQLRRQDGANNCRWDDFFDSTGLDGVIQFEFDANDTLRGITGLDGQMDVIHWENIIVAGWSQGAGNAVWIALHEAVGGVFLLDAPSDMCLTDSSLDDSGRGLSYYDDLVNGVLEPSANAPRFGVYHQRSTAVVGSNPWPLFLDARRPVAWDDQFPDHVAPASGGLLVPACDDQHWDDTVSGGEPTGPTGIPWLKISPNPETTAGAAFTSMSLNTDQPFGGGACGAHESVALSHRPGSGVTSPNCMPCGVTAGASCAANFGQAVSPEQANLFEANVQGFCTLGAP